MARSRSEVVPKNNQFGGGKGCRPAHMLIETTQYITSSLEDNRAAVIATSMDYSKAFNRLNHSSCLESFKKKGAATKTTNLLASFLKGRTMSVKVGEHFSVPRSVLARALQGSVLGAYLFNIGIDNIMYGCKYPPEPAVNKPVEHLVNRTDCSATNHLQLASP